MTRFLLNVFICLLGLASCSRYALIDKVPVEFKTPGITAHAVCDPTFNLTLPEYFSPTNLQIVQDSILVVKKQSDDASSLFFSAYSIRTLQYLGSFLPKGRGPGEMLSPSIAAVSSSAPYLYVRDNSLMLSCAVDVMRSIRAGSLVSALTIPAGDSGPIWLPVKDSLFFSYDKKGQELLYKVSFVSGEDYKSFSPFRGIDLKRYFTQMSEIPTSDGGNGKLAFPMVFFPMLHLLDVDSGRWRAIAVDSDWRNWRTLLKEPVSMDKIEYYAEAISSSNYIIALFRKHRLGESIERGREAEIHFFDWEGNFLYRIIVGEDLTRLTFDSVYLQLYGIDRASEGIVRYDLSSILCQ